MSFCQIEEIEKYCNRALGALRYVKLYVPEHVSSMPDPMLGAYAAEDPVLVSGKTAFTIPFNKFSASLNSRPDNSARAGDFWVHTIEMQLRKNRLELGKWMLQCKNRRFHLLTTDWHGERMWFPFMRLSSGRTHDASIAGNNAITFTFSRVWNHPGIYLAPDLYPSTDPSAWGDPDASEIWDWGGDYIGTPE